MLKNKLLKVVAAGALTLAAASNAMAVTPFEQDVATAIDKGLAWMTANGAYNNPSSAGDAAGFATLALLEKRPSGNPGDPPQGYAGASAADQAMLRTVVLYMINQTAANGPSLASYRDGERMMALSRYALTGGPDVGGTITLTAAINSLTDKAVAGQTTSNVYYKGFWGYSGAGADSSTTQFMVAGLSAAKGFYSDPAHADAARLAAINTALGLAKDGYVLNAKPGSDTNTAACPNVLEATEAGHGYQTGGSVGAGYVPSLQQTASGLWVQLLGGSNVNSAGVQQYIRWIRNRYRYDEFYSVGLGNSWPHYSYFYYLFSSFKGQELIQQSGVAPTAGNLSPNDYGTLPSASAPACNARQSHRSPATDVRPALFTVPAGGGAGYYSATSQSMYYDYAYQLLNMQCADGRWACAPVNANLVGFGNWGNQFQDEAYGLLVLQRATGGACNDTDGDGICDNVDNCPAKANADQADRDGDKIGDACDNCPSVANPGQEDANRNGIGDACEIGKCDLDKDGDIDKNDITAITGLRGQTSPPADSAADADSNGIININDARACVLKCTRASCATQ